MKAALVIFAVLAVGALKVNADLTVKCTGDVGDGEAEYHRHPCDCSTYYVCVGTEPIPMSCPKGLYWNQKLKICVWLNAVECKIDPECY